MSYEDEKLYQEIEDNLTDNYEGKVYNEDYEGKVYEDEDNFADEMEIYDAFNGSPESENLDEVEVYENYSGEEEEDDNLDYHGQKGINLKKLEKSTKRFSFKIVNKTNEDKTVALTAGPLPTTRVANIYNDGGTLKYIRLGGFAANAPGGSQANETVVTYNNPENLKAIGVFVDAVIDDGYFLQDSATSYVFASALKKSASIREFRGYLKIAPTAFAKMHIGSDKPEFYKTSIVLKKANPYGVWSEDVIPLEDYYKPENYNKDKIEVTRKFQLDNETVMIITIPAETTVTFSFVAGVSLNPGNTLAKKMTVAQKGHKVRKIKGIVSGLHKKGFRWIRRPGPRPLGHRFHLFRIRRKRH